MLKLIGVHKKPYSIKEGIICIKAVKLFNSSIIQWKNFISTISNTIAIIENKIQEEILFDLKTGGQISIIVLTAVIELILVNPIKEKVINKLLSKIEYPKKLEKVIKRNNMIYKMDFMYHKLTKKSFDWKLFFRGTISLNIGNRIINRKQFIEFFKIEFGDEYMPDNRIDNMFTELAIDADGNYKH